MVEVKVIFTTAPFTFPAQYTCQICFPLQCTGPVVVSAVSAHC